MVLLPDPRHTARGRYFSAHVQVNVPSRYPPHCYVAHAGSWNEVIAGRGAACTWHLSASTADSLLLSKGLFSNFACQTKYLKTLKNIVVIVQDAGKGVETRLIRCTLGSGKSEKGLGFWRGGHKGTREQWGTRGSSLQTTWDRGGRFLSQLEGAK